MSEEIRPTIAIVTPYFPPNGGGLERYAKEIALNLEKEYGYRIVVITSGSRGGKDSVQVEDGLTVYRLSYSLKISNTPFSFAWFSKIKKILKKENPEIINVHMPVPGIADVASLVSGKIPTVVTYHSGSMRKSSSYLNCLVYIYEFMFLPIVLRHASHIVCSSDYVRDNFLKKYKYKSSTITPAVDSETFQPDVNKKTINPSIIFVAGLGWAEQYKGLQNLIDAVVEVKKQIPDIHLNVVGDGDMRGEYESRVINLGMQNNITFTGRLNGMKLVEQYQKSHILVQPSSNESFSMVILEAMSCGLPVIATNVGSTKDMIVDKVTGFLLESNDVKLLSVKILEIINNNSLLNEFGEMSNKKIKQNYSWKKQSDKYRNIFGKVSNKKIRTLKKIAIVTPYFFPSIGGLQNYALQQAKVLRDLGHDVFVITSNHIENSYKYEVIENIRIYRLPSFLRISNTPWNPFWRFYITNIYKKENPGLIIAHTPVPYISDIAERVKGDIPYILNYHNDLVKPGFLLNLVCKIEYFLISNKTISRANKIITTSKLYATKSKYINSYIEKVIVLPPPVDTKRFTDIDKDSLLTDKFKDKRNILFVGQVSVTHSHKGLSDLLKSISIIKKDISNICLFVVGGGDGIDIYKKECTKLNIQNNVVFEGFVSDKLLPNYYAGVDVLAFPSKDQAEGFGMVVIEAAATGTPSVATNVGGVPAAVLDGETGILVEPNQPEIFAEAIKSILNNIDLKNKLGNNAKERVIKEFSLEAFSEKISKIKLLK